MVLGLVHRGWAWKVELSPVGEAADDALLLENLGAEGRCDSRAC